MKNMTKEIAHAIIHDYQPYEFEDCAEVMEFFEKYVAPGFDWEDSEAMETFEMWWESNQQITTEDSC